MSSSKFVAYLSNFEVYEYFKELKENTSKGAERGNKLKSNTQLSTIAYEALHYLQESPCSLQSKDAIEAFLERIQPYNLTKAEKLCMLNMRPISPIDIQTIVEESEERLTEEQINEIILIVEETLPIPENLETDAGNSDGEEYQ